MDLVLRLLIVVAIVVAALGATAWLRRRDGRVVAGDGRFGRAQLAGVGLDPDGAEALALLLGSPTCVPCRTVRAVLDDVAGERPGLRWVYVDAADHLDLARAHHVMRVPTLFVLDPDGRVLARTSGVPGKRDLLRVIERGDAFDGALAP